MGMIFVVFARLLEFRAGQPAAAALAQGPEAIPRLLEDFRWKLTRTTRCCLRAGGAR